MMVRPVILGNPRADYAPLPLRPPPGEFVEVAAYPNSTLRKCVWMTFLLSSLLVLHAQQDLHADAARWRGGVLDTGDPPFPWELQALVSKNDSFEATFVTPVLRQTPRFVQAQPDAPMLVTHLGHAIPMGVGGRSGRADGGDAPHRVATAVPGPLPVSGCAKSNRTTCYVGVQPVPPAERQRRGSPVDSVCHQFTTGTSLSAMRPRAPAPGSGGGLLCLGASNPGHVHTIVPTSASDRFLMVWNPPPTGVQLQRSRAQWQCSCLAVVSFPGMQVGPVVAVDWSLGVFFDSKTASVLSVGFSSIHTIIVDEFSAATLKQRIKYVLPLSSGWLLRAPRVSDGFMIFISAEPRSLGTTFVIDLQRKIVYEQEPPTFARSRLRPRRWRLPQAAFPHPENVTWYGALSVGRLCSAVASGDVDGGRAAPAAPALAPKA